MTWLLEIKPAKEQGETDDDGWILVRRKGTKRSVPGIGKSVLKEDENTSKMTDGNDVNVVNGDDRILK
jgi:hypothetical protein